MYKQVEIELKDNKMFLSFIGAPIPPVKKALKENGFVNKKGTYSANITAQNKFFVKLISGVSI